MENKLKECSICMSKVKIQNLDKHMHSRGHHKTIMKIMGGQYLHRCWACDMYLPGLEQFFRHIDTSQHVTNLHRLAENQRKGEGIVPRYNNNEVKIVCAKKEEQRLEKRRERWKKRRAKTAWKQAWNRSPLKDMDFTTDDVPQSIISPYWLDTADRSQKRSQDPDVSDGLVIKRPCLREVPSAKLNLPVAPRSECTGSSKEIESHPTYSSDQLLSVMLKDISASVDKIRMSVELTKTGKRTTNAKKKNQHVSNRKNKSNIEHPTVPRSAKKIRPVTGNVFFKKAQERACSIKCKRPPEKPAAAKRSRPVALNEVKDPQKINHILPKLLHPSGTETEANEPNLRAARGIITAQEPRKHTEMAEDEDEVVCLQTDRFSTDPLHRNANLKISEIKSIRDVKQETQDVPDVSGVNRRQLSELLTISLREEELNSSLQEVDWQLHKAQAVLHSAFIEVQHLQMIKQRITAEMASLRAKQQ